MGGLMLRNERRRIVKLALARRGPVVAGAPGWAEAGALLVYSADVLANFRRAAYYVDRILKGTKPGDIPIEQPTKFELVVNLKTAKAIGLTIPHSLLLRGGSHPRIARAQLTRPALAIRPPLLDSRQPSLIEVPMRRIGLAVVLAVSLILAPPLAAWAQQPGKVYRVGYLTVPSRESAQDGATGFQDRLRDLGWVNGQNLVIEYRFANGDVDRLPALAAELVRLRVDVIAAAATPAVAAAKNATRTIPIVMFLPIDPIGSGLVDSLARPSGNITGLSAGAGPQIYGKQLQLLKDAFPRISHVAILVNQATSPFTVTGLKETELAARALGLQRHVVEVRDPREFDNAFAALTRVRADAIFVPADPLFFQHRTRLAELAAKTRLPAMWGIRDQAEAGGLMAYGVNLVDLSRRAATYVDKILKGAKPSDLPVEQPTRFELVINLKTAKALGLTIPQTLLLRADQVIE
jgi:putative ABC transport system substrate-binding protein